MRYDFNKVKRIFISTCLLLFLISTANAGPFQKGQEVMVASFNRDDGADAHFNIKMVLIDKNGGKRKRELEIYTKDYEDLIKTSLEFISPADIKGTTFLSWENADKDDTQYLYLPALKRARRIVSSQKKLRFVNTDYTYEDMQRRRPEKDEHDLIDHRNYNGSDCYVIESIPVDKKNSQYTKRINWVDKDSLVVVRVDFFDKKGDLSKQFSVEKLEKVKGIWTNMKTCMQDFKDNHTTIMTVSEVVYNQGLGDELFSIRALEEK